MPKSRLARSPLRFAIAALAVVLVSALLPTTTALAAADSDIPGVPLPGSVVTGRLGGPIYDRVYQLDVEPNRIILLSLTGGAGTDFDLYLFDSSATTVYGGTGQVAASTGRRAPSRSRIPRAAAAGTTSTSPASARRKATSGSSSPSRRTRRHRAPRCG